MSRLAAVIASVLLLAACVQVGPVTPAPSGSALPSRAPTLVPTAHLTAAPTQQPTVQPTTEPTDAPTTAPTDAPITAPTDALTPEPTDNATPEPSEDATPEPTGPAIACAPIQFPGDLGNDHLDQGVDFTGTYSSSPPSSGPHDPVATTNGTVYEVPQRPEELIHAMEHGAVVFWANDLSAEQQTAGEAALADIYAQGYESLIWTPYADMDVPFAMTAWGALQTCTDIDPAAMQAFVDNYYGSGLEGIFACFGAAAELPGCTEEPASPAPTDGTAFPDAAEAALLEFVPEAFRDTCVRPFADAVGATADVDCFPERLGADQASYAQFPSTAVLEESYAETLEFLEVESDAGQCSLTDEWPGEGSYTIGSVPAGRVLCTDSIGTSSLIWWTDTELDIKSLAINSAGDREALYQFWVNDSGPIRP